MNRRSPLLAFVLVLACRPADTPTQANAPAQPQVEPPAPAAEPEPTPAGVVVPRTGFDAARVATTRVTLQQIAQIAEMFRVQRNACPSDVAQLKESGFSARVLLDGWDRAPLVQCVGQAEIVVVSAGPDGAFGSADDLRNTDLPPP